MPNTEPGHEYAGSADWSDTATVVSDSNTVRPGATNGPFNNTSAGSQTENEPRYASAADGGPPNGGLTPGTYLDKRTNRIFSVGTPPLALPIHLRPPTSNTPFVRLHGFQDHGPYPGPGTNPHSGSGSHHASDTGSNHSGEMRLFPVGSNSTSTTSSNTRSGSLESPGNAWTRQMERR